MWKTAETIVNFTGGSERHRHRHFQWPGVGVIRPYRRVLIFEAYTNLHHRDTCLSLSAIGLNVFLKAQILPHRYIISK